MARIDPPRSARRKIAKQRERLRAQGLSPVKIRIADVSLPAFKREARRQSALVAESARAPEDQAFIVAASDPDEG
jgi:Protein  of unknown function (DUF3018)